MAFCRPVTKINKLALSGTERPEIARRCPGHDFLTGRAVDLFDGSDFLFSHGFV